MLSPSRNHLALKD